MKKIVIELNEKDFLYLAYDLYTRGKTVEQFVKTHLLEPIEFIKYLENQGYPVYEELMNRVKAIYGNKNTIDIKL